MSLQRILQLGEELATDGLQLYLYVVFEIPDNEIMELVWIYERQRPRQDA
jgi:hypothetical protein